MNKVQEKDFHWKGIQECRIATKIPGRAPKARKEPSNHIQHLEIWGKGNSGKGEDHN